MMTFIIRAAFDSIPSWAQACKTISKRCLSLTKATSMPYKPEERPPLTDREKRLYPQVEQTFTEEGYPVLNFIPQKRNIFNQRPKLTRREPRRVLVRREEHMKDDQDWPSVWPVPKTFSPSAVPLPLRQSYEEKNYNPPRGKYANTELLKIPNFLHLTPLAIERHCEALKKFCTKWPEGLETDEEVRAHFPITVITRDFVHSAPTIRDVRARIINLKINIQDLKLKPKDKDKFIRLATHRYNKMTGELSLIVSACPLKKQNTDYAEYLLTALYFESLKHEDWEDEKEECDWERFFWDRSQSKVKIKDYVKESVKDEDIEKGHGNLSIEDYRKALEVIHDNDSIESYESYRNSVEKLLGFEQQETANEQSNC